MDFQQCLEIFWLSKLGEGVTGIQWAAARDPTKHPNMHRTPTAENYPGQIITSAEAENPSE